MSSPFERFLFRLALNLGFAHPRYLKDMLSYEELHDWLAYDIVEGLPSEYLNDRRNALSVCSLLKVHLKKDSEIKPDQFLYNRHNSNTVLYPPKPKTQEQIAAEVKKVFSGMVKKQEKGKKKNVNTKHRRSRSKSTP